MAADASATDERRTVLYRLSILEPATQVISVAVELAPADARAPLVLALPAWTPGSYKIRDFARHLQDVRASDPVTGAALRIGKRDKQSWVVWPEGAARIAVTYRVFCDELTVRTCQVTWRHAFLNGAGIFLYVEGEKERPCEVEIAVPAAWRVATALAPAGTRYRARDYDELVDSPIEASDHEHLEFVHEGVLHEIAICGGASNLDREALLQDVPRIVGAHARMLGGSLPFSRYTFIVHVVPGEGAGGLEHKASTAVQWSRFAFRPKRKYEDFLSLLSHEYFHLWNGKRIRPEPLGPFDYRREQHTPLLWAVEGITSYYEDRALLRAGIIDAKGYLKRLGELIDRYRETPGRLVQSLSESSFDSWIKYYQRSSHWPNSGISYYDKGKLVALLLDIELRAQTHGERSLDDVLRMLWQRYGAPEVDRAYPEEALRATVEEVLGADLGDLFARAVDGTEDLDLAAALERAGIRWNEVARKEDGSPGAGAAAPEGAEGEEERAAANAADAGLVVKRQDGAARVVQVVAGGPAWRAGVNAGDEVLALDGVRVDEKTLARRLEERRAGDRCTLHVFRGDEILSLEIALGAKRQGKVRLEIDASAGDEAKRLREGWLGAWLLSR